MRYSVLSRFQGAICGKLIAQALVNNARSEPEFSYLTKREIATIAKIIPFLEVYPPDWLELPETSSSAAIALATLPLTLLFHDNPHQWEKQLQSVLENREDCTQIVEDVLIWGYGLTLALREKLETRCLISQLLERYGTASTPLIEQLKQVQTFLEHGTPLEKVVFELSRHRNPNSTEAIALSYYCFAHTPEDFHLCLMRSYRCGFQISVTTPLTAALAGAYNSFSGIPLPWRLKLGRGGQELSQKIIELFAVWSGVKQLNRLEVFQDTAIALSGTIQPRPSLKIVSQKDF
jgi:hypothetical protein